MYAVIFASKRPDASDQVGHDDGYEETAERMFELCTEQPGFVGFETARSPDGSGITVCYWETEAAIASWREHAEHVVAQEQGRAGWYDRYRLVVCQVLRDSDRSRS